MPISPSVSNPSNYPNSTIFQPPTHTPVAVDKQELLQNKSPQPPSDSPIRRNDNPHRLTKREDNSCTERLKEKDNKDARYTIHNQKKDVCPAVISAASKDCYGLEGLLPSENAKSVFTPRDETIVQSHDWFLVGHISTTGSINRTTADCIASKYTETIDQFKNDTVYKAEVAALKGGAALLGAGMVGWAAYIAYRKCLARNRASANQTRTDANQTRNNANQTRNIAPDEIALSALTSSRV
jgi:hypothetical protein